MKLTKEQRHTAYILIKSEIDESCNVWGFCIWIKRLFGMEEGFYSSEKIIKKHFPELWNKRPKQVYQRENHFQGCLWFPYYDTGSNKKRSCILEKCIEETY